MSARQLLTGLYLDHRILTEGHCRGQRIKSVVARPNPSPPAPRFPVGAGRRDRRYPDRPCSERWPRRQARTGCETCQSLQLANHRIAIAGCCRHRAGRPSRVLVGRGAGNGRARKRIGRRHFGSVRLAGHGRWSFARHDAIQRGAEAGPPCNRRWRGRAVTQPECQRHRWRGREDLFRAAPRDGLCSRANGHSGWWSPGGHRAARSEGPD